MRRPGRSKVFNSSSEAMSEARRRGNYHVCEIGRGRSLGRPEHGPYESLAWFLGALARVFEFSRFLVGFPSRGAMRPASFRIRLGVLIAFAGLVIGATRSPVAGAGAGRGGGVSIVPHPG